MLCKWKPTSEGRKALKSFCIVSLEEPNGPEYLPLWRKLLETQWNEFSHCHDKQCEIGCYQLNYVRWLKMTA
jgi:hypothetical protein